MDIPAQQGNASYLDKTLAVMAGSGDSARVNIARRLVDARNGLDGFRVKYMEVKTKIKGQSESYFLVSHWID